MPCFITSGITRQSLTVVTYLVRRGCAQVCVLTVCACAGFAAAAIDFFNAVKQVAEAEGHHPDLHLTNYREVEVSQCCITR